MSPALETAPPRKTPVDPTSPVRLTDLSAGDRGRLHATDLESTDREMLRALGLGEHSHFRVCKAGDPWILQVRSTRVGLSDTVARRILVIPHREPHHHGPPQREAR